MDSTLVWVLAWSPFTSLASAPDFASLRLECAVQKCQGTARLALVLDAQQQVWEVTIPRGTTDLRPKQVQTIGTVVGVACSDMVAFAWTQEGLVFAWGMDPSEDGLMGLSGIFSSAEPVKIQGLGRIAQVAVGKTHAAAIDGKI